MVNTITRDFGYIPVEFRDDWGVRTIELTAFCTQWHSVRVLKSISFDMCVFVRAEKSTSRDWTSALFNMGVLWTPKEEQFW